METCVDSQGEKWLFYLDHTNEWKWRRIAKAGGIIGMSPESYKNKSDCVSNAQRNGLTCTPK